MSRSKALYYVVVCLRWYLAFYMFSYGFSKITEGQFGVYNPELLNKPLQSVDTFHISWYLFGMEQPFKYVIGILQIIGSILIVIEPLAILGAIFLLPIILQIFIIDISYVKMLGLSIRLFIMLLCDIYILYFYRDKLVAYFKTLIVFKNERAYQIKYWYYLLFLIVGFLLDFVFSILATPIKMLINFFS